MKPVSGALITWHGLKWLPQPVSLVFCRRRFVWFFTSLGFHFSFFLLFRDATICSISCCKHIHIESGRWTKKRKLICLKLMLLQLLPQFFSLQHLSVNLSLSFVAMFLLGRLVNFTLVWSPMRSVQGGKAKASHQISTQTQLSRVMLSHQSIKTDIWMHLLSPKKYKLNYCL